MASVVPSHLTLCHWLKPHVVFITSPMASMMGKFEATWNIFSFSFLGGGGEVGAGMGGGWKRSGEGAGAVFEALLNQERETNSAGRNWGLCVPFSCPSGGVNFDRSVR